MLLKWRRQWSQANRDAVVKNEGWTVRTRIVACLIALVLALGLAVVVGPGAVSRFKAYAAQNDHARNQQGPRPTAVVTAPVQTTDFPIMRYSTGFLSSPAVVNVASRIASQITEIPVKDGQTVKAGDILFKLEVDMGQGYYFARPNVLLHEHERQMFQETKDRIQHRRGLVAS